MAYTEQNRRNQTNNGQIPGRVEDAARSMASHASSGPRRGYIPPDNSRIQTPQQGGWQQNRGQQAGPYGYYSAQRQPQQQPYYNGQSQTTGSQRGYIFSPVQNKQPQKPKKHHTVLIVFTVLLLLGALGTGGYFGITHYLHMKTINEKVEPYNSLFCPGVYVDGIHLGGMTPEQAMNSVQSQIQQRHDAWKVQLTYEGAQVIEINSDMLEFNVDPRQVLNLAWQQGHTGDEEQRYEEMLRLEQEPYVRYTAMPEGNTGVIDQKLAQIKEAIDTPAVDSTVTYDPTQLYPFVFTDEAYGRSLDTEPIKERLYQMVSTMESGTVEIVPERLEPAIRKADLMKHYMLRSDKYTPISKHSPENRNNNIRRAFELINGYVLEPGKTFSFNKVVGERTVERGFFEAEEYVNDEHVKGIGGGVCQASTTLYQAAVCAGLQIGNREPHSDSVSYTGYGEDATVFWFKGGKKIDFTFKNNTENDIYIIACVQPDPSNKKRLIARVLIYGEDMGDVRYELETTEVETIPCMLAPKYVSDKSETAKAKDGHVVDSYRVEYTNGVETDRKKLYRDTYEPKPEKIYDPAMAGS
jgi:vancomycin resistance protein YoaR